MKISGVLNRWLNRLYKILAVMLVFVAVLVSAFRLFLPYAPHYRQNFQDYLNDSYQMDIAIGSVKMEWQKLGPVLVAEQVDLLDTADIGISVQRLSVQINVWRTLTEQRLVSHNLNLHGASVNISQEFLNRSQEKPTKDNSSNTKQSSTVLAVEKNEQFEQISALFLNQVQKFSLTDSQVLISDGNLERRIQISELSWLNQDIRHQAQGTIVFDGISSNNVYISLDLQGKSTGDLVGKLYLKANDLDVTPWLGDFLVLDSANTQSTLNFSAWAKVEQGIFQQLLMSFDENKLTWQYHHLPQLLTLSSGTLLFKKRVSGSGFSLHSSELSLTANDKTPQTFTLEIDKQQNNITSYFSGVDLSIVKHLLPLFSDDNALLKQINQLDLQGAVKDIFVHTKLSDEPNKVSNEQQVIARFDNISNEFSDGIPGLSNISGTLNYSHQNLVINIKGEQGALDFKQHFVKPIPYTAFTSDIEVSFDDVGWQVQAKNINLTSEELSLSGDVSVTGAENEPTKMSLLAEVTEGQAIFAHHYYPLKSMSDDLNSYLQRALVKGKIAQAVVLYHGVMENFPFENQDGVFVVDAELTDSSFLFDTDWPIIEEFNANLNFTNNSMVITGRGGNLVGLDVTGMEASIASLSSGQILTVDTVIAPTKANNVTQLMLQSPLKDSVGAVLQQLVISDDITGEFHLNLPLNATDDVVASGKINFENNHLSLQRPQMEFSEARGELVFVNDKITTNNLQVKWLGLPLQLSIEGEEKEAYYLTKIGIDAMWENALWQQHVPNKLKKYAQGKLSWQGNLALYQHHNDEFSYDFTLSSNLLDTALILPAPYRKSLLEKMPLFVSAAGKELQSTINVSVGQQLRFFAELDHENARFSSAHLVLGNEQMFMPIDGFHITTELEYVNFSLWQPLISDIIESVDASYVSALDETMFIKGKLSSKHSLLQKPERVRGTIKKLDLFGQTLTNVSYNLLDKNHWWVLQLNAKEARSQIKLFPDLIEQGIDIDADFIHLVSDTNNKKTAVNEVTNVTTLLMDKTNLTAEHTRFISELEFENIPKITLHCDSCKIGVLDLGEVDFILEHTDNHAIEIKNFTATRNNATLKLSAQWLFSGSDQTNNAKVDVNNQTFLSGQLVMKDLEQEITAFGYESIIRDSDAKIDFSAHWQGSPQSFDATQLNGEVDVALGSGYLADIKDKARIFSVLSLQSLVRKLSLDFRDIFSDGMFYSDITAKYQIEQGISTTDNFVMEGNAGDLVMKGITNLHTGELDYKMTYKPNYSSSLPAIAWIATLNPVTFLAGIAIDQVITSQVVSEFKFELTGTIDNPNFQEVDRKNKDVSIGGSPDDNIINSSENFKLDKSAKQGQLVEKMSTEATDG